MSNNIIAIPSFVKNALSSTTTSKNYFCIIIQHIKYSTSNAKTDPLFYPKSTSSKHIFRQITAIGILDAHCDSEYLLNDMRSNHIWRIIILSSKVHRKTGKV